MKEAQWWFAGVNQVHVDMDEDLAFGLRTNTTGSTDMDSLENGRVGSKATSSWLALP